MTVLLSPSFDPKYPGVDTSKMCQGQSPSEKQPSHSSPSVKRTHP